MSLDPVQFILKKNITTKKRMDTGTPANQLIPLENALDNGTRESVSTVTDGLSFALNSAKVITQFSFGFAKFATSTSINLVKAVVDTVGANTGLDATGITPIISGTLMVADKISNAGIRVGEYFTNLGLDIASGSVDQVGNVFGNTEMNAAIEEFAALVMREMQRDLDEGQIEASSLVVMGEASGSIPKRSLASIGTLETIKSITAWICLQRMSVELYNERALATCSPSLLESLSNSKRPHHTETNLGFESSSNIEEIETDETDSDVVIDGSSDVLVFAHIGRENDSSNANLEDFNVLSPGRLFQNIRRYVRFAAGSYGKLAINVLDPSSISFQGEIEHARRTTSSDSVSGSHAFFSSYTGQPISTIYHTTHHNKNASKNRLLSSITTVPRILPENTSHYNPTFYIVLDHPNKSVLLCLRGTLTLHDLLIDLTCDYAEREIGGVKYLVHSGMFQAAERVALPAHQWVARISQQNSEQARHSTTGLRNPFKTDPTPPKVYEAVNAGLTAHPGYSLIVTGHSLGAGLAALIALQWGDPVTGLVKPETGFPPNTRIHGFSYATPAIISRIIIDPETSDGIKTGYADAFNSLVTNIVIGDDFVPDLSLGSVRDLTNVVGYMHGTPSLASSLISQYVSRNNSGGLQQSAAQQLDVEIRGKCFTNQKLFPVGRTFWVPTENGQGADVREVLKPDEGRFGELVFGLSMVGHHLPTEYERVIRGL
ncbi:hypothetical protein BDR26DRAFT_874064 [Obelidium mucronatum]|nr:hypothetical protein BDR26DRAFT_874064 [Obelidium mucronatum]